MFPAGVSLPSCPEPAKLPAGIQLPIKAPPGLVTHSHPCLLLTCPAGSPSLWILEWRRAQEPQVPISVIRISRLAPLSFLEGGL